MKCPICNCLISKDKKHSCREVWDKINTKFKKGEFSEEKHPNWQGGNSLEIYGKDFDRELMEHVVHKLSAEKEVVVPIVARDKDPAALEVARQQVKQLELQHVITVEQGDFMDSAGEEGITLIMNPPYGERLKHDDLESLYGDIGSTLKHRFPGSDAWILSSSKRALGRVGLKPASKQILFNGALECFYVNYLTFKGNWKDHKAGKGKG